MADANESGWRPYLVMIPPDDVIGWKFEVRSGREVLLEVRIKEDTYVQVGRWERALKRRIRVLTPGQWELWEKDEEQTNTELQWSMIAQGESALPDVIPMVTAYADRTGFFTAKPPLLDLACENIAHFQSRSDQRNILHVGRVPILFGSGIHDAASRTIIVGSSQAILEENKEADLKFVEITGTAIEAGKDDLESSEQRMGIMALEPLVPKPGNVTATERAIDTAEAHSSLQSWAIKFNDAYNQALAYLAILGGENPSATITLTTDFGYKFNQESIDALDKMRARNDLSGYWHALEMQRKQVLSDDYNWEEDQERLAQEGPDLGSLEPEVPDLGDRGRTPSGVIPEEPEDQALQQ